MGEVWLTTKVKALLDKKVKELGVKTEEGLVNAIFLLALTDRKFLKQAQELNRDYFEELGQTNLEEVEKKINNLAR